MRQKAAIYLYRALLRECRHQLVDRFPGMQLSIRAPLNSAPGSFNAHATPGLQYQLEVRVTAADQVSPVAQLPCILCTLAHQHNHTAVAQTRLITSHGSLIICYFNCDHCVIRRLMAWCQGWKYFHSSCHSPTARSKNSFPTIFEQVCLEQTQSVQVTAA